MLPEDLYLRPATAADADAIIAVTNAAFAFETFIEGPRTNPQDLERHMQTGKFLVAHDGSHSILDRKSVV